MTAGITRRDFMNGIAIAVAGAAGVDLSRAQTAPLYPPGRDGLRGSHDGSFEAAHRLRDGARIAIDVGCHRGVAAAP